MLKGLIHLTKKCILIYSLQLSWSYKMKLQLHAYNVQIKYAL